MTTLQKQLILCYYDCMDPVALTGAWGEESAMATKKLQELMGLYPSGVWDPETESAVRERLHIPEE